MILLLFRFDIMFGYLVMGFMVDVIINCVSLTGGFRFIYKRNYGGFLIEFQVLEYFWFCMLFNRSLGARLNINIPCRFLNGVPRNLYPFKDTQYLPCVDLGVEA